jgi:hypothetical protein
MIQIVARQTAVAYTQIAAAFRRRAVLAGPGLAVLVMESIAQEQLNAAQLT